MCTLILYNIIETSPENPNKNRKPASESVFILDSEDNIIGQIDVSWSFSTV